MSGVCFAARSHVSRQLNTLQKRWITGPRPMPRKPSSHPDLFRQLEDGSEQPITVEDLSNYQRHRWLRNESKELDLRYRPFKLASLMRRVAKARIGPDDGRRGRKLNTFPRTREEKTCVKIVKLLEGDHNKVFLLTLDDGDELIARLPNPNAGLRSNITASEIATRLLVERVSDIPMPKLWDWEFDDDNTIGSEFIIEAKATGEPLRKFWFTMSRNEQLDIVRQVVELETKLAFLKFAVHGSIYSMRRMIERREPIIPMDERRIKEETKEARNKREQREKEKMDQSLVKYKQVNRKQDFSGTFINKAEAAIFKDVWRQYCVGPSTDRRLYRSPGDLSKQYRGPFTNLLHYATTLGQNEKYYISTNVWKRENIFRSTKPSEYNDQIGDLFNRYHGSQESWITPEIDNDACTISHPDLSLDNIFIDPETKKISCLTGWQCTTISPPALKPPYPRFLDLEFQTQSRDRNEIHPRDFYRQLVKKSDPLRYERVLRNLEDHNLRTGPMSAVVGAWDKDDMYTLRETLVAIGRSWLAKNPTEPLPWWLDFDKSSTFESHAGEKYARQEFDLLFNMVQNVQSSLKIRMDGRVRAEDFELAQELSKKYRQEYLELAEGDKDRQPYLHEHSWTLDDPAPSSKTSNQKAAPSENSFVLKKHLALAAFRRVKYGPDAEATKNTDQKADASENSFVLKKHIGYEGDPNAAASKNSLGTRKARYQ